MNRSHLFDQTPFETHVAVGNASSDDVLSLIDYPNYFRLMQQPLPDNRRGILARLQSEKIIAPGIGGGYDIANAGAVLFSRELKAFDHVARKALRIIYGGENRVETVKEELIARDYAVGFAGAIAYINDQLPQNEQIGQALRGQRSYPSGLQ